MHGSSILLTLLIILIPLEWYTFQGVKTLTRDWRSSALRNSIRWGYWIMMIGLLACLILGFRSVQDTHRFTPFVKWTISIFVTLFMTKIVFVLILFGEDIYRGLTAVFRFFRKKSHATSDKDRANRRPLLPERRKWISQATLLVAGIPFASFIYGIVKGKYDFKVHRKTLYFEDLPENFEGFTITQISDIHSGSFDNVAAVQRGIDIVKEEKSDLFVFTGDLVNNVAEEILPWLDHFQQLKAPYGQFSILGNHDYGEYVRWSSEEAKEANLDRLKQHHATLGYRLLLNENVTIAKGGQKLMLLGVENWGKGFIQRGDLDEALKGVDKDAFKVLLSHDPSHWDEKVRYHPTRVHLTLSGHTHGMQFGVEIPGFKWSPAQYRYPHWADLAQDNGRQLYVNRGFGFIGFSGRVGIWPEVTVITLKYVEASVLRNKLLPE